MAPFRGRGRGHPERRRAARLLARDKVHVPRSVRPESPQPSYPPSATPGGCTARASHVPVGSAERARVRCDGMGIEDSKAEDGETGAERAGPPDRPRLTADREMAFQEAGFFPGKRVLVEDQ